MDEGEEEGKERELPPAYSEIARRYARAAVGLVESVGGEVRGLKGEGEDEVCRLSFWREGEEC